MRKICIPLLLTLLIIFISGCASKPFYPTVGMTFEKVNSMSAETVNGYLKQMDSDGSFQIYETYKGSVPGQTYGIGEQKKYYFVNGVLIDTKIAEKQLGVTDTNMSFNETLICIENAKKQDELYDGYTGVSSPRRILVELSSPKYIKCPKLTNTLLEKTLRNEFPYAFNNRIGLSVSLINSYTYQDGSTDEPKAFHISCLSKYGNLDVCPENLFTDITQKISRIGKDRLTKQQQEKTNADEHEKAAEAQKYEPCLGNSDIGVCNGNYSNGLDTLESLERMGMGNLITSNDYAEEIGKNDIKILVRNNTSSDVKDVTFSCNSISSSGTVLNTEEVKIFEIFPKHEPLTLDLKIREVKQTKSIKCRATRYAKI